MSALPLLFLVSALAGPTRVDKLDNGVELVTIDRGLMPLLYFRIAVRLGSAFDPPGKSGLAQVATTVIQRGLSLERRGVELKTEVGVTSAVIFGSIPSENADDALPEIIERLDHPQVTEAGVKSAIAELLEDGQKSNLDDRALAEREMRRLVFGAHAYGRAPRADVRDTATISSDDVQALLRRQIHAESVVLAVAEGGTAPRGELAARAAKWTATLPKGRASELDAGPPPDRTHARRIVLVDKPERRLSEVCAGLLTPGALDPRRPAIAAAVAAIGGSFSSRLLKGLDKKLGVLPLATIDEERTAGALSIAFSAEPDKLVQAIRALFEELGTVHKSALTEEEMRFGRAYASARAQLELRDPAGALKAAVRARVLGIEASAPWAFPRAIETASDDEVRAAAKLLATPEDLTVAVVVSVTPKLQAELAALPGVKEVSIVPWE